MSKEFIEPEILQWYLAFANTYPKIPEEERNRLYRWINKNPQKAYSDWPGWEQYIGKKPPIDDDEIV